MPRSPGAFSAAGTIGVSAVLGGISASMFFSLHAIGGLALSLQKRYGVSAFELGLMMFFYSVPNVVVPLYAGDAIDRVGLKSVGLVSVLFVTAGSAIFALAPSVTPANPLPLFYLGRGVLGCGGEAVFAFSQAAGVVWFGATDREALSLGVVTAVNEVYGSGVAFFALESIAARCGVIAALWVVVGVCGVSLALLGVYAILERAYRPDLARGAAAHDAHDRRGDDVAKKQRALLLADADYEAAAPPSSTTPAAEQPKEGPGPLFWLQNLYIFFAVSILYISANFFPYFLHHERGMSFETAGRVASLFYFSFVFAPVAGAIGDAIGHRLTIQSNATAVCAALFVVLYVDAPISAILLVCLIGLTFATIEQTGYTLLSRTFPPDFEGTGFGIMSVVLNGGLGVIPVIVGHLKTTTHNYNTQNIAYVGFLGAGLAVSAALAIVDRNDILNLTADEFNAWVDAQSAAATRGSSASYGATGTTPTSGSL